MVQRAIRANILDSFGQRRQFSNLSSVCYTNLETFTIKFSPCVCDFLAQYDLGRFVVVFAVFEVNHVVAGLARAVSI